MQIDITARRLKLTQAIDLYIRKKISGIAKNFDSENASAHIVLTIEKNRQIVEINFHCDKLKCRVKEESLDLYTSIDLSINRLKKQLQKHKEISKDNRKIKKSVINTKKSVIYSKSSRSNQDYESNEISRITKFDMKPINISIAIENMKALKYDVYMFYNIDTDKVNVVYNDRGSLVLLEPNEI
jgi:putative sigma-54 modulation protein